MKRECVKHRTVDFRLETDGRETEYQPTFPSGCWRIWLCSDICTEEIWTTSDSRPITFGPLAHHLAPKFLGKGFPRNFWGLGYTEFFSHVELEWLYMHAFEYMFQRDTVDGRYRFLTYECVPWLGSLLAIGHGRHIVDVATVVGSSETSRRMHWKLVLRTCQSLVHLLCHENPERMAHRCRYLHA